MSSTGTSETSRERATIVIVGTGFSGLGMAIQLLKDGRDDFVILEKAHEVGGTWRDNTYPGCACDIQSHMYSFSYEQNPNWSRAFSGQPEIFEYLKGVADKYGLREFIRFGVEMTGATWNESDATWTVTGANGETFVGSYLISGVGALHIPNIPKLSGIETFQGEQFHSADWNHDYDLHGKRVAVIGTGASAIQFVPQIAPEVERLTLFQRTPPWVMPKPDHQVPRWAKALFRRAPITQRAVRNALYWFLESRAIGFNGHPAIMKAGERVCRRQINKAIKDPELRAKLTPDYRMGCKRVLQANDYYPALARQNVDVITDGIAEVRERSIIDSAGVEHEVDAIIYGTGFHVTDAFDYLDITGENGRDLSTEWAEKGMTTHKGITVEGFPNLFFLLGPNTGLGHMSVVFMIESQARYVIGAINHVERSGARALRVRSDAQEEFQREIQDKLAKGVWSTGGCTSWYLDAKGVNRTLWPGFTWKYWLETRKVDTSDYELVGRRSAEVPEGAAR
ncbi:flavin-containing monooxygenase [Haloechinothrix halophila]|uniref:flavin-containing monooxygenase n=1 Tax=Haloechinothrix halophila TaxID=1069073 RepID=UPI000417736D|nr:NAD(P)/FAD-dependent oxidoreductase [Haloechinothrix halophila]